MNTFGHIVEVDRAAPQNAQIVTRALPDSLKQGQVLARVDRFALTANNATYALFGEAMGYYGFYPAAYDDRGIVPVWGYALIETSQVPGVEKGQRLYGFWPFASHVVLEPTNVTDHGFVDGAAHRQALHGFYNMISFADQDPFSRGDETLVPALKPLFSTAWLLEDFFARNATFGAKQIIMTSASSKTALGTAYCAKAAGRLGAKRIALTSKGNMAFVKSTGLYDDVVSYEDVSSLDTAPAAVIDFAGNPDVLGKVHSHFGDTLRYSCQVGKSHSGTPMAGGAMPGPKPVLFFAPDQARGAAQRMGAQAFQQALFERWCGYTAEAKHWFDVKTLDGLEEGVAAYQVIINGEVKGAEVFIVSP